MSAPGPEERERTSRIRALFLEVLSASPEDRPGLLEEACEGDQGLRREVERLLEAETDAEDFLGDLARRARTPFVGFAGEKGLEGRRLGAYRVLRELGRGGMGAVYLAERADMRYEKRVAIKLLPLGLARLGARNRFLAERRLLASLDHPGIASLLDAGVTDDGTPYFIMDLVEGEPITRFSDRGCLGVEERIRLFLQVCDAVQYAHSRKVVHRDLKPTNILVTPDGQAKLLDFGIAKVLDEGHAEASTVTRWGGVPMTPSYASPEQVAGDVIGFTSDVYQLGVLLYELLAGCPPHSMGELTLVEVRTLITEQVPSPPSEAMMRGDGDATPEKVARHRGTTPVNLQTQLRDALDSVVLKALEKAPEDRYDSVQALATDLGRHLSGARVEASQVARISWAGRVLAGLQRSASTVGIGAALLVAAAVVGGAWSASSSSDPLPPAIPATSSLQGLVEFGATSTDSEVAHSFFREGLSAHYQGFPSLAHPLFGAAVREDSTFALAWFYLGHSSPNNRDRYSYMERATRLAHEYASDRERLLISAWWADWTADPALSVFADSLVARYPHEAEGHLLLGTVQVRRGRYMEAIPHFERVVAMDSVSLREGEGLCLSCDALNRIVSAYVDADSLAAGEREARRWVRLQPGSATAWERLAWTLWRQDRVEEAVTARFQAAQRRATTASDQVYAGVAAIRAGNYPEADVFLAERVRTGTPDVQREALWWQMVSFRYQRRLDEALAVARRYRRMLDASGENRTIWDQVGPEAQVLFEMGRFEESLMLMGSAAAEPYGGLSKTRDARHQVWILSHAARVAVASGDTSRARVIADSMEVLGRGLEMAYGRDLHQYAHGLLHAAQGDADHAAVAFRKAIASNRYARGNLDLARLLIGMGQEDEAVLLLQQALRGPILSDGFWVIRPELYEALGRAWEAAGRPDSAVVNYRRGLVAWEGADPDFDEAKQELRARLASLQP